MDALDPRHGTTAGHAQHRKAGEKACRPCQDAANAASYARTFNDHDVPLTGGRWVNVRGIMRWQKDPETIADAPVKPKRRYAKSEDVICGTVAGYYRHKRKLDEPACEECRAANAAAERARYARRVADRAA